MGVGTTQRVVGLRRRWANGSMVGGWSKEEGEGVKIESLGGNRPVGDLEQWKCGGSGGGGGKGGGGGGGSGCRLGIGSSSYGMSSGGGGKYTKAPSGGGVLISRVAFESNPKDTSINSMPRESSTEE
uniref:Loricrin-like n=1 Tax=Nelumbo nucifera TaxID=4432 RepID=A0A822Y6H9_NELNU|nr:TPA_asm: hypothetical protein HUJ06_028699 [Nelumbo nucifera]